MFKSLSSRSLRPSSHSGSSNYTRNSSSSSTYTPLPPLPPVPPTPERDIPSIQLVAPTPGNSAEGGPLLEKRRTRTLVPRRSVLGKENRPKSENPFSSAREAPTPVDPSLHVTGLVARQFTAQHNRQFHSVGPSAGLSLASQADPSSSAQGSLKAKSGIKHKRVLVESRAYPGGGQVEVVKDTVGRSSKPLLESVRGTFSGGSVRTVKGGTVRNENDENTGTGLVVKKKKSRGTLESIRWALGDRTNGARKAEKEKEKSEEKEKESEGEQERKRATLRGSVADRPKTRLTIDTHVPREVPLETPITATVISPMTMTPGTLTGNTTDNESLAAPNGGEKTKWRWTINKRRAKSPGPSLSSTFDRPAHIRSNSLDPNALMAAKHTEEPEESAAYTNLPPRASSLELPTINSTADEEDAQGHCSPVPPPTPMPVETAPVDFGFEPKTVRKASTASIESRAESGTTRKSSIGSLLSGVGENASNTGSFAVRAMRSVRSIASLARLGGWAKGEEDEKEKEDGKDKGKSGAAKEKKKRRVKKKPVVVEEEPTTSGESWEAGALGHDPTITVTVPIGKPITRQNLHVKDERAYLGVHRITEASREEEREEERWARRDHRSSSGSSYAAPSTISSGSYHQSRMSRASSGASSNAHTVRSRQDSVPAAPNVPANPGIIFEHHEEVPASTSGATAYLGDSAWVGVGADTLKGRTRRTEGGEDLGRRARKPVIGLFDIPTAEESQPKGSDGAPHVEVRGVKIDKGRVRERVRAFEACVEERTEASAPYSTFSVSSSRTAVPSAASNVTSLGRTATSVVDKQRLSYIQEREYTLSSGRCVSLPIFRPSTSPERPARVRPRSEQVLRQSGEEAIDIVNAANSDLSDLISRLDLTFTPEAKQASPDTRRIPAWVEGSPTPSGPRGSRGAQPGLTSLKGYSRPSLVKPASSLAPRVSQALPLAETDDLFSPGSSRAVCGHQYPRPRAIKGSGTTSAKSSNESGRTRIESRRRAGMKGTLGEDSMLAGEDSDGPDSDIPDELQVILAGESEDKTPLPSPGMPPDVPLPQPEVPRVVIEDTTGTQVAVAVGSDDSDDNEAAEEELERGSRKSFDFTGELGQLKGGSRSSFVEVLVTAFKTPARSGGSGMADQLELSIDSLNVPTVTKQGSTVVANEATTQDEATEAEISFSRAEALAKLTQPMNKKSSGQLDLDFRFGPQTNVPAKRPQENNADTSLMPGSADATFALALANLAQVSGDSRTAKRRDASIRFKMDAESEEIESSRSHSHTRDESGVGQSMSSLGNILHSVASDPFGFNQSRSRAQSSSSSHATQHSHQEPVAGVLSVPSYGRMLNVSQEDPFDYEGLMRELDEASSMIEESTQGLERSVARRRRSKRMSVESDRSSFYCRTNAPPVSFLNRGYGRHLGHSQHLPTESGSSLANPYGNLGANAGRVAWGRHRPESADSSISDRYDQYLARPGLGDKMFQAGVEHGIPLPSIMASPTNSEVSANPQFYYEQHTGRYSYVSDQRRNSYLSEHRNSYAPSAVEQRRMSFMSYDSLVDGVGDERRHSIDMESLYERRGRTNSISSVSVFGDDHRRRKHNRGGLQPGHFRPVSIISMQSDVSARDDDDTMVSMIGGNGEARVRRKSVGSTLLLDASPCFRAEKRAKQLAEARSDASRLESGNASTSMSHFQLNQSESQEVFSSDSILDNSPSKGKGHTRATPRPFARPRPPAAAKLTAEDYSLEEIDSPAGTPQTLPPYIRPLTVSCRKSRPMGNMTMSVARNRASALICTAEPPDTPPLSIAGSDASSISGGSQSSIDVSKLMGMLGNTSGNSVPSGRRARAHGQGHRRRSSQLSRSSMVNSFTAEDLPCSTSYSYSAFSNSQVDDSVMIVDPDAQIAELAEMIEIGMQLSDEQMASVTRYCALRNEAIETVERSQKIWQDTDFSRFALSTFTPPTHPSAIKAMIDYSQDTYTALPTELYKRHHPRHFRSPRISPYPTNVTRSVKSVRTRPESVEQLLSHLPPGYTPARPTRTVQESPIVSNMGMTFVHSASPAPAPLSSLTVNLDPKTVLAGEKTSKQRVTSSVRRSALGWVKRKTAADGAHSPAVPSASKAHVIQSSAATVAKENMGVGMLTSPSNQSLRINRPRPKGRSSASTLRTALRI